MQKFSVPASYIMKYNSHRGYRILYEDAEFYWINRDQEKIGPFINVSDCKANIDNHLHPIMEDSK